ncbi:MAG: hypothetical protein R2795_21390 [Saprospiraceae bacterium]
MMRLCNTLAVWLLLVFLSGILYGQGSNWSFQQWDSLLHQPRLAAHHRQQQIDQLSPLVAPDASIPLQALLMYAMGRQFLS